MSVPWQIRFRRAQALKRLGQMFRDAGHGLKVFAKSFKGSLKHGVFFLCLLKGSFCGTGFLWIND